MFREVLSAYSTKIILLGIFLLHLPYLLNGFIWLDHRDIEMRRGVLPLLQIPSAFFQPYADTHFYRPVVTMVNSLDYFLYHSYAFGYHLTNILLLLGICFITPKAVDKFVPLTKKMRYLVMVIYGIHPLSILPSGAISYRPELLMTLFLFISLIYYVNYRTTKHTRHLSYFIIFSFLALFSKETALYFLPIFLAMWELGKRNTFSYSKNSVILISFLGLYLLYGVLRISILPSNWYLSQLPLSVSAFLGTRIFSLSELLLHFFSPFFPSIRDTVPVKEIFDPQILLLLGIIISLVFVLWKILKDRFALYFFLLLLLPSINILPLPRFYSPHYGFTPLFALIILCTISIKSNIIPPKLLKFLLVLWLGVASITTFLAGYRYKNDESLFLPESTNNAIYPEGSFYLGYMYAKTNQLQKSERAFMRASADIQGYIAYQEKTSALINLAAVQIKQNELEKASQTLKKLKAANPANSQGSIKKLEVLIQNKK